MVELFPGKMSLESKLLLFPQCFSFSGLEVLDTFLSSVPLLPASWFCCTLLLCFFCLFFLLTNTRRFGVSLRSIRRATSLETSCASTRSKYPTLQLRTIESAKQAGGRGAIGTVVGVRFTPALSGVGSSLEADPSSSM